MYGVINGGNGLNTGFNYEKLYFYTAREKLQKKILRNRPPHPYKKQ